MSKSVHPVTLRKRIAKTLAKIERDAQLLAECLTADRVLERLTGNIEKLKRELEAVV